MKRLKVDPDSPVPLYHQIAEDIRARIKAGELAVGDALVPLREAARAWGVNLHTVRHAYAALAREGLVESRGPNGTKVTAAIRRTTASREEASGFIERIVREARDIHDLSARELAARIVEMERQRASRPTVFVVECSALQCEGHAREITKRYEVDAREWSLERGNEPPLGSIVATYFHYNDIRRLWPHRLREVRFVTIAPDTGILERLPAGTKRVLVCEKDEATAETVAADLSVLLESQGCRVEPIVGSDPIPLASQCGKDSVVLVPPRVWATLGEAERSHPHVLIANYVIEEQELSAAARELGWLESARDRE